MTTTPTATDPQAAALAAVQAYCGWTIAPPEELSLTLDGPGRGVVVLPSLHVTDVTSITEDGTLLDPATDYSWSESGVVRRGPGWRVDAQPRWTNSLRGIVVEFISGYGEMPPGVQNVIDALATGISSAGGTLGLQSRTVGPFTEQYAGGASDALSGAVSGGAAATLARYRLPWLA